MQDLEEPLLHYGVKGMRWGVRNESGGSSDISRKAKKADEKWARNIQTTKTFIKVHNRQAAMFNRDIRAINEKPEYKNAKSLYPDNPVGKRYTREAEQMLIKNVQKAVDEIIGKSPSGRLEPRVYSEGDMRWRVDLEEVKHADDSAFLFQLSRSNNGAITKIEPVVDELEQSDLTFEEVLAHYGVKGMKWGVRRDRDGGGSSSSSKPPEHADATRAKNYKKTAKAGTTDALSTKELQELVNRMNLEQQYSRLRATEPTKFNNGQARVKSILATGKTVNEVVQLVNSPAVKLIREQMKNR